MDRTPSDISDAVFKRVVKDDLGHISMDSQMLSVLMEIDGKKRLSIVAQKTGLSLRQLRTIISRLQEHNLIEPVEGAFSAADRDFFHYLHEQLSRALGPLAGVLIEDSVASMGYEIGTFPSHRAAELVNLLSHDIKREDKQTLFKQNMLAKMKAKRY